MRIDSLEQKIAHDPRSPVFAWLAEELLRVRRADEALKLCLEGLRYFPDYATAHFVAARCFAQKNEFERAIKHLEHTARTLPGNEVVEHWLTEWRAKAQRTPSHSQEAAIAEAEEGRKPEGIVAPGGHVSEREQHLNDEPIVSVTLAEIYSTQGAYEAAIAMYRRLQQQKPHQASLFESKIGELKEKIRQRSQEG